MTIHEAAFTTAELDTLKRELGIAIEEVFDGTLVYNVTSLGNAGGMMLFPSSWIPGDRSQDNNDVCIIYRGPCNSWHGIYLTEISRRTLEAHRTVAKVAVGEDEPAAGIVHTRTAPGIVPVRTVSSKGIWVFHRNTGTGTVRLCAPSVSFDITEDQWPASDGLAEYFGTVFGPTRVVADTPSPPSPVSATAEPVKRRKKASYVGAPAIFILESACRQINEAYAYCDIAHIYMVGSALERADWRDVDLRMIMSDADFQREFPDAHGNAAWEMDPKWSLLVASISGYLTKLTGLPIDFQFQPMSFANERHRGPRNAMGMRLVPKSMEGKHA